MKRSDITDIWPEATKEQIDKIMDINGADIGKAKGDLDSVTSQLTAARAELEALKAKSPDADLQQKLKDATDELNALKQANSLREIREKVSKEIGVPASLLTGATEEECKTQAQAIKDYAKPQGYPSVPDNGEVHTTSAPATRDKFAEWLNESLKK